MKFFKIISKIGLISSSIHVTHPLIDKMDKLTSKNVQLLTLPKLRVKSKNDKKKKC